VYVPPVIQSAMLLGSEFTFTWSTVTNKTYQVQATASLTPPDWIYVSDPVLASNTTATYSQAVGTNLQQYYRVVQWP
jgi:hypothetical protein